MATVKEKTLRLNGTTAGCADHDYDLIQDLGHRLDALWHYEEHYKNATGHSEIQSYWLQVSYGTPTWLAILMGHPPGWLLNNQLHIQ